MALQIINTLKNPFKFKLYLLKNLPLVFITGLKLEDLSEEKALVSIRYKFLNKNPFHSLYFACLAMAAELPSGVLGLCHIAISQQAVSMLVVKMEADFTKKAVGKIVFTCSDGKLLKNAVEETIRSGEGKTIVATSIGVDESGDKVAEFRITWSFKARKKV
jgi:hypothetical protein